MKNFKEQLKELRTNLRERAKKVKRNKKDRAIVKNVLIPAGNSR